MAILKKSKMREMADAELQNKLFEFVKELNSERGLLASGGRASNSGKLRELRKSIARIMTIQHERKLGIVRTGKPAAGKKPEGKPTEKAPAAKAPAAASGKKP